MCYLLGPFISLHVLYLFSLAECKTPVPGKHPAKLPFSQALLDVECALTWVYMHIHKSMTEILSLLTRENKEKAEGRSVRSVCTDLREKHKGSSSARSCTCVFSAE